jgi:membrane-associated phospholipid phosphatase
MQTSASREARDYNRGPAAPVRWAHTAAAALPLAALWRWASDPTRRTWAQPLLIALPLTLLALPLDGPIARFFEAHQLGGDARRELEALQQYGQLTSSFLIALVIWLQDPARRRQLANWAAAFLFAAILVFAAKGLIGRPRPKFDDPWVFLWTVGQYPLGPGRGIHHAWEFWAGISSDLWSMPSSHTVYAFVMATFLAALYPRLRELVFALAALVGLGRIITHSHYPSDVIAGAGLGLAAARTAIHNNWGLRVLRSTRGTPA